MPATKKEPLAGVPEDLREDVAEFIARRQREKQEIDDFAGKITAYPDFIMDDTMPREEGQIVRIRNTFGLITSGTIVKKLKENEAYLVKVEDEELVVHEEWRSWQKKG